MSKRNVEKAAKKAAKKHPKLIAALAVIVVLIIAVIIILWFAKPDLFHKSLGVGDHTWGEWDTKTEATCIIDGTKQRTCLVCGETEEDSVPSHGHAWSEWDVSENENCGKDGLKSRECSVCKKTEDEKISATGNHDWGEWETVTEAICGKDGTKKRVCSVCGGDESEPVPALVEHTWVGWITAKEPTCGEDGLSVRRCSVCGERENETLPATGLHNYYNGECTVCGNQLDDGKIVEGNKEDIADAELSIHFLELGNANAGDCTLIKCGNTEVLIDAGSKRNSTQTVKNYINKYCTDGTIEYVIATHAHEDHIAALVGENNKNNGVLYSYNIGTVIEFAGHKTTSQIYNDYVSAVNALKDKGTSVYTAKQCWYETDGAKKQYFLDEQQTISLNILYQKYYDQSTSTENNYSVCTMLTQKINENTEYNYLFTGDLEKAGEESLVASNNLPKCKLFKGGHHGSSTSSNDVLLSVIQPEAIAICTCAGTYEYAQKPSETKPESEAKLNTFPTQEALDRMAKWTDKIYVTSLGVLKSDYSTEKRVSMNGDIVFYYDKGLKLYCSNNTTILKDTDWFKANRVWSGT